MHYRIFDMKRLFDFCGAFVGLLLVSPVMMAIALAIAISSRGPLLFSQHRVGRRGRPFRVYKFRSMVHNAAQLGTSVTTAVDHRITGIGRILRRTKLDELPQLWNVLKGDMSFVGPRPDVPEIVDRYTPEMRHILDVRPGITSIATLYLRDEESLLALSSDPDRVYEEILVPFKVALALQHAERDAFLFDMKILLHTTWALSLGRFFPPPGKDLVAIVRTEIVSSLPGGAGSHMERVRRNWDRYRDMLRRPAHPPVPDTRTEQPARLAQHSSARGT
jgi:lipopolysaccharide/colanic/teichoic acid biosynthesis glycosyltransferase